MQLDENKFKESLYNLDPDIRDELMNVLEKLYKVTQDLSEVRGWLDE